MYLGKVLHRCETAGALEQRGDGGEEGDEVEQRVRDLQRLVERLSRVARFEAAHHPKQSIKVRL